MAAKPLTLFRWNSFAELKIFHNAPILGTNVDFCVFQLKVDCRVHIFKWQYLSF